MTDISGVYIPHEEDGNKEGAPRVEGQPESGGRPTAAGNESYWDDFDGVSLRDYFAAHALAGITTRMSSEIVKRYLEGHADGREAVVAYMMADAMLKARKQ